MACRRSGVRAPVAPPSTLTTPSADGVSFVSGHAVRRSPSRPLAERRPRARARRMGENADMTSPSTGPDDHARRSSATTPPSSSRAGSSAGKSWACTTRTCADGSRPRYYLLTMYPYPSGDLHIGHWYIETPTDARARFLRMNGHNVFFPIGFDAFGLPAENAAISSGVHPADVDDAQHREHAPPAADAWAPRSTGRPRS